ncbi:hypothetical protein HJFPF1_07664 [Paramyrothecium foliicola]|nr:hypothetical protein HJFPF1_07664 [Paramyrothecium foliicola]
MHFSHFLLNFITAAAAIDVYLETGNCWQNSIGCINLAPNTCCSAPVNSGRTYTSVSIHAIPQTWSIEGRAYREPNCVNRQVIVASAGRVSICLRTGGGQLQSGGYGFINRKRDVGTEKSADCQKPNALRLTDGSVYRIDELEDDTVEELLNLADNGTLTSEILDEYNLSSI